MKINLLDVPVYYINMEQDVDKDAYLSGKLKDLGFKNINRLNAIRETPGIVGLSKSQNLALSQIKAPFIILEDDADPMFFEPVIEVPDDADAVYLGNSPWARMNANHGFFLKYTPAVGYQDTYRIYNMLSSHAILYLTDSYVDVCKRTTNYCATVGKTTPMDVPFASIQKFYNVYAFDKPHFGQKEHSSQMSNGPAWTRSSLTSHKTSDAMTATAQYSAYRIV